MTTIAWDGQTLAGDGYCFDEHYQLFRKDFQKVRSFKKARFQLYRAIAGAGNADAFAAYHEWIEGGCKGKFEMDVETDILMIDWEGNVWCSGKSGNMFNGGPGPTAIGCGSSAACAAMLMGMDAVTAVRVAATLFPTVGGTGTAYDLKTHCTRVFQCEPLPQLPIHNHGNVRQPLRRVK